MTAFSSIAPGPWRARTVLARATLAAALAVLTGSAVAAPELPPGVSCRVQTLPAKTAAQKAAEAFFYGKWESFEERDVHLDGLPAPETSTRYRLLSKRPGQQPALDKPLVIFLHGFPEFAYSWENWLKQFGTQFDSIAIDLKGHGYSAKPVPIDAYKIDRLARELDHVAECLGYKQVITVGHDWGAGLAWSYALSQTPRLKGLVILSTPHPYTFYRELADPASEQRQRSHYIETIRENTPQTLMKFLAEAVEHGSVSPTFYKGARLFRLFSANMSTAAKWDRMFSYYRAMDFPPQPEMFPAVPTPELRRAFSVNVPTLAIWGKADPYFSPKSWEGVQDFVPKLDLRAIEGAGHWINHEQPEVPGMVLDFVKSIAGQ